MEQLLASKNLATAFYCYAETAAVLVICRVIGLPVGWPQAAETLAVYGALGAMTLGVVALSTCLAARD